MTRWQTIKSFLVPQIFGRLAYFNSDVNSFFAYLEESDPLSRTPKIQVTGIPQNSILLKIDNVREGTHSDVTQPLFLMNGKHLRHRCDYVLLTHLENKDVVIFFELKSKNFIDCEVTGKFNTSTCLLDFIASISKNSFKQPISFSPDTNTASRYVLIYVPDKPLKASKNKKKPRVGHCSADHYYKYPAISCGTNNLRVHYTDLVRI